MFTSAADISDDENEPVATAATNFANDLSGSELRAHLASGESIVILDVRPAAHYYRGHVRSAVSLCVGAAAMRADDASTALAVIERQDGLDAGARHALKMLPLAETVIVYDSGAPPGQREGPAFWLGDLLAAEGAGQVAVLRGGYGRFATEHGDCCAAPPPSAGHSSAAGVLDLTPKGAAAALPAARCFQTNDGHFDVWVGGARDAADRAFLDRNRITHIINCTKELPSRFNGTNDYSGEQPLHYLKLGVLDECEADLGSHLDGCVAFLEEARRTAVARSGRGAGAMGSGALVHCYMGRSRSVTVAAAFIGYMRHCTAEQALETVRVAKPDARPNTGFMKQLDDWLGANQKCGRAPK